jgi:hypothetical protein
LSASSNALPNNGNNPTVAWCWTIRRDGAN